MVISWEVIFDNYESFVSQEFKINYYFALNSEITSTSFSSGLTLKILRNGPLTWKVRGVGGDNKCWCIQMLKKSSQWLLM